MSRTRIARVALVVEDYELAIDWFQRCLDFALVEDTPLGQGKRWVRVAPKDGVGAELLLAKAANEEQRSVVGKQGGGRVFLFLETEDFARDHARMMAAGVHFLEEPRVEPYGTVAVFEDLCGNRWDLIEPA
ncbi:VOC family protein [Aurantimonas sp. 22II-16-19i]|uniref:VOC family protein n=1 Tax=Aurantimonas sp. 22II-16-19i TaxID=1317114 RepID=UPI0009F7BFAD|nr:VOC family protein [Aurantimonas sp. 22II-16-19i]ORE92319.1 glyoxalase/bleomycin resistance protein/dioxygenase [Aurantimonas sp. 22II-16-19i]